MKPEVLILSVMLWVALCDGFKDRYPHINELLHHPGGLIPMLPPDKRYTPESFLNEMQRMSPRPLPLLPTDKRDGPSSPADKSKSQEHHSDKDASDDSTVVKRLRLPSDRPQSYTESQNNFNDFPFWRTGGRPMFQLHPMRPSLMLPPDKRMRDDELASNLITDKMFQEDSSMEDNDIASYFRRKPALLLPPDKKELGAEPFPSNKRKWLQRGMRQRNRRLRRNQVLPILDEKDKAVVNLIESASEVLHSLAEKLKAYNGPEIPNLFPYNDDTDLGKRVPLLPFEGGNGLNSVASALAQAELASSRAERSASFNYNEFNSTPRKLPLLPFDKRSP